SGLEAALGEVIPLSGYSPASQWVYLYLTGPNLPENGVPLNDVTRRADQGAFTKVSVDGNDYWSYKWNTGNVNGKLDEGTYTIWVVNGPNDRSNLAHADYRTISVRLGKPYVAVDSVQVNGAMEISSNPSGARVTVNGQDRGATPLTVSDLRPGSYQVAFTLPGYYEFSTPVTVEAGRISEVKATLAALPVPTPTTELPATVPATAAPSATPSTTKTTHAAGMVPAVLTGIAGVALLMRMRT
ncbi:MAG: PEGA domain-containing protein, partial [Methanomicrobiales archaeon]|nr:PEGA domain-containing protein [Methanomicrobiales archaeon]